MAKDKYDFIQALLENKKLSPSQRERVLLLMSAELKKDKDIGATLEERVKIIEEKLYLKLNKLENLNLTSRIKKDDIESQTIPVNKLNTESNFYEADEKKYLNPGNLYQFLFDYNQNRVLNTTCHEIDANALEDILEFCYTESYDFQKHIEKIVSSFEELDKKYYCSPNTKAVIRGYITGKDFNKNELKNGWTSDNIKISWSSPELIEWSNNKKIPPNSTIEIFKKNKIKGFDFEGFTSSLFGNRVQTFRDLVLHFKSLFHVRADNSMFSILKKANEFKGFTEKVEFDLNEKDFPQNIELFTDVNKLVQGYIKIIDLIIKQHNHNTKPKVKISYYQKDNKVFLSIHHQNNTYNKSIQDTIDRGLGQTYTNLINKQLNGICNLYLKADFGIEGMGIVNLWDGKKRIFSKEGMETFNGGVEHILEFCKA
jgi:hypothetical protein